jgi:hypothetical protein
MSNSSSNLTLNKIGNFVGLRFRELLDLLSGKADRAEVDALPRFREAANSSEMLNLNGIRVGDFCLRMDTRAGFRLRAFPASDVDNWLQVFSAANASVVKTEAFAPSVAPIVLHSMGRIPTMITVVDSDGRVNVADWRAVDMDRIQMFFTEMVGGVVNMTFSA